MRNLTFSILLNILGPAAFIGVMLTGFEGISFLDAAQACSVDPSFLVGASCGELQLYSGLKPIAWIVGALGILLPVFNFAAPILLGSDPQRLARIYPRLFPFTLGASLVLVIVGLGFVGLAGHILMFWVMGLIWWYAYLIFAIGAFAVLGASVKAVTQAFDNKAGLEFGVKASREDSPALFEIVDEMAAKVDAPPPVNLVVGPSPNFYITDAPLRLAPSNTEVSGETVFISATLAEVMSREELASIVAHELMHYKGEDLVLTRSFFPIYRRLNACIHELAGANHIMAWPVLYNLANLEEGFATAERKISRTRELAADNGAAAATTPNQAASALLKASLFSALWPRMVIDHALAMNQGERIEDAPGALYGYLVYEANEETIESHIGEVLKTQLAHPVDTHPTLAERLDNWGVKIEDLERDYYAHYERDRSAGLFTEDFIRKVTDVFEEETYARVNFRIPKPDDPQARDERMVNRALYGIVEYAIRSDGQVQPEEVIRAEQICREHFAGFSSLLFRERLHGEVQPKALEELVDDLKRLLPQDKLTTVKTLVNEIIDADGEVDDGEAVFRETLFGLLEAG